MPVNLGHPLRDAPRPASSPLGRQFTQLPMFVTPAEVGSMRSGDFARMPVNSPMVRSLMERGRGRIEPDGTVHKSGASYLEGMAAGADKAGGIEVPVHVLHEDGLSPLLVNGHHRAQVAMDTNRLLPAIHHDGRYKEALAESKSSEGRKPGAQITVPPSAPSPYAHLELGSGAGVPKRGGWDVAPPPHPTKRNVFGDLEPA